MRTETTTRTLYQFGELSDEAKRRAIEKLWNLNVDHDWWDCIEANFKEDCAEKGITVERIEFSASHCQGDYAAFYGQVKWAKFMEWAELGKKFPVLWCACEADGSFTDVYVSNRGNLRFSPHSDLWMTKPSGVFEGLDEDMWDALVEEQDLECALEDAIEGAVAELCADLLHDLYEEAEYLESAEMFIEYCEASETTFEEY